MAVDRDDQDGCFHIFEIIFSSAFRDPTYEQSSAAASAFMSLLRGSSITTINEIKELAERYLEEMSTSPYGSPMNLDNVDNHAQERDSDSNSDGSKMSDISDDQLMPDVTGS